MKKILLTIITLSALNSFAVGGSNIGNSTGSQCKDKAIKSALALFNINNTEKGSIKYSTKLILNDLSSEISTEVWDIRFTKNNVTHVAYRMTLVDSNCVVYGFQMPEAN